MRPMPITAKDILDSDGKHQDRRKLANAAQVANAAETASRVNALLLELGMGDQRPDINDGFRDASVTYGAPKSAHKEGKALDLSDSDGSLDKRLTRALLIKYRLRREDSDSTPGWCHLDTREPFGSIFAP